jgi:hypothetical protein
VTALLDPNPDNQLRRRPDSTAATTIAAGPCDLLKYAFGAVADCRADVLRQSEFFGQHVSAQDRNVTWRAK